GQQHGNRPQLTF
nr:immunoglobulin light chain junction region [Macaca mulatta]MPO02130.1 immunoglobulin light chain junction region [Macaca mulatta]